MGFLKKALKIGAAPITGGASLLGGNKIKDALFGAKDPGTPDRRIDLDPKLQKVVDSGRDRQLRISDILNRDLDRVEKQDPSNLANLVTINRENQARALGEDKTRQAKDLVAQRGLSKSSSGINAILNADKSSRDQIGSIRANKPLIEQGLLSDRLNQILSINSGISSILGSPGTQRPFVMGRESTGRSGGILGLLTGTAGAYGAAQMGGNPVAGFGAGMSAGNSIGNMRLS